MALQWRRAISIVVGSRGDHIDKTQNATYLQYIYFLFIKIHKPDKNIHTVNAVKQAENKLV